MVDEPALAAGSARPSPNLADLRSSVFGLSVYQAIDRREAAFNEARTTVKRVVRGTESELPTRIEGARHLLQAMAADPVRRGNDFAACSVITDLGMPHVDGRRAAAAVKAASSATSMTILTGWGQRMAAESDIPAHVDRLLAEPPKLREALGRLCRPRPADGVA